MDRGPAIDRGSSRVWFFYEIERSRTICENYKNRRYHYAISASVGVDVEVGQILIFVRMT